MERKFLLHVIGKLLTLFDAPEDMLYSCFEKGCPTKPYTTMPKGIMGNGGSWSLIKALGVSQTQGNSTNKCIYAFSFLVGKHREPQSINVKLFLPTIPIGIVAYDFSLLWDNLCRNSCILLTKDDASIARDSWSQSTPDHKIARHPRHLVPLKKRRSVNSCGFPCFLLSQRK